MDISWRDRICDGKGAIPLEKPVSAFSSKCAACYQQFETGHNCLGSNWETSGREYSIARHLCVQAQFRGLQTSIAGSSVSLAHSRMCTSSN